MTKKFKGKAIYQPDGPAGEYAKWAVNFYNGCSGDCDYCYNKTGVMRFNWSTTPTLKKTLIDSEKALLIFESELVKNIDELWKNGLFFNFVSDPFLDSTIDLNYKAMEICNAHEVPIIALSKQSHWLDYEYYCGILGMKEFNIAFGFTLTGYDKLESGCSPNFGRINTMNTIKDHGKITWASIEPIIDIDISEQIIYQVAPFCDHFKIGIKKGSQYYSAPLSQFVRDVTKRVYELNPSATIYFKDSLLEMAQLDRAFISNNWVTRDYNLFEKFQC